MNNQRVHAYIYLLIVSVIWGAAGPVIKFTLGSLPPLIFLTYRFGISALVSLVALAITRPKFPKKTSTALSVLVYGFMTSTVTLGLLFFGFEKTTALTGTLISAVQPLLVAVAGGLFLKEHITTTERIGIGLAFVGTLFTIFVPYLNGGTESFGSLAGNLLVLASLLSGVITAVHSKILLKEDNDPALLTHIAFIIGFITIVPFTLMSYDPSQILLALTAAPVSSHIGVLYMAILSGTLAYWLWHKGQKTIEISEAALFSYLTPLWATPLAVIWLGEKITVPFAAGAMVIATGVAIAEYRKRRRGHKATRRRRK